MCNGWMKLLRFFIGRFDARDSGKCCYVVPLRLVKSQSSRNSVDELSRQAQIACLLDPAVVCNADSCQLSYVFTAKAGTAAPRITRQSQFLRVQSPSAPSKKLS